MNLNSRISVAMATYNGERFIREQIDSILNQTLQFDELVICDDCSSDSSIEILESYALKDHRIKIYKNHENLGFLKNFQKALLLCSGDYIALSDQDDIWCPNHIKDLYDSIGSNYLSCGLYEVIDGKGGDLNISTKEFKHFYKNENSKPLDIFMHIMYFNGPFQGASMMMSKEFVNMALPIPDDCDYHDLYFSILASIFGKISVTSKIITNYRQHEFNVSDTVSIKQIKKSQHFSVFKALLRPIFHPLIKSGVIENRGKIIRYVQEKYETKIPNANLKVFADSKKWFEETEGRYNPYKRINAVLYMIKNANRIFYK